MQVDGVSIRGDDAGAAVPTSRIESLPHRLRLLWIGVAEPSWVGLTLKLDAQACLEPQFHWASTPADALAALRDANFDCVLASDAAAETIGTPRLDPISLLQAIRGSGYDEPVILVTTAIDDDRIGPLCELDCDMLVTPKLHDSPALLPVIRRAMTRVELGRENHRLSIVHRRRLVRERDEAEHLLGQQRRIIADLDGEKGVGARLPGRPDGCCAQTSPDPFSQAHPPEDQHVPDGVALAAASASQIELPRETKEFYHELLRAYVIMGSGNLGTEIARLAELLVLAGISPREALGFHLERVESLVLGLGNRSARHVMARADLLALELMIHIGEGYRRLGGSNGPPAGGEESIQKPGMGRNQNPGDGIQDSGSTLPKWS